MKTPQKLFTEKSPELYVVLAAALGTLFGAGLMLAWLDPSWADFGLFMAALAVFHVWEWLYVALFHPDDLSGHCAHSIQ